MVERRPNQEFGRRRPAAPPPAAPVKRSGHVGLLMMGTLAVGGGAYALMPSEHCQPTPPGMAAPAIPQSGAGCAPRGSSGGATSAAPSDASSGSVTRGGFGSFARAFGFSGGG